MTYFGLDYFSFRRKSTSIVIGAKGMIYISPGSKVPQQRRQQKVQGYPSSLTDSFTFPLLGPPAPPPLLMAALAWPVGGGEATCVRRRPETTGVSHSLDPFLPFFPFTPYLPWEPPAGAPMDRPPQCCVLW